MDFSSSFGDEERLPKSKSWKRILRRNEQHSRPKRQKRTHKKNDCQIPDTERETIRCLCLKIENSYNQRNKRSRFELFGWCIKKEETNGKDELLDTYKKLGQKVWNESGKSDWNDVAETLKGILKEMKEIGIRVLRQCPQLNLVFSKPVRVFTDQGVCVENFFGEKTMFDDVKASDPVEKLLTRIEEKDGLSNQNIELFYNGKKMERNHLLADYGVNGSSPILMINVNQNATLQSPPALQRPPIAMYLALALLNKTLATLHMTLAVIHLALAFQPLDPVVPNIWELYRGFMQCAKYFSDTAALIFKCLVNWFSALLKDWTRVLTEKDLVKIAEGIGQHWEVLGIYLGLKQVQLDRIKEDNKDSTLLKIFSMLTTWLNEKRSEATVGKLYQTMTDCKVVRLDWNKITSVLSDVCRSGI